MKSAKAAGVSYTGLLAKRRHDPALQEGMDEAMQAYRESLESEAHRRAVDGVEKPVFYKGSRCDDGDVKEYSDRLLELMLKRHIPEFREKLQVDANVRGGVLVVNAPSQTEEEFEQKHGGESDGNN